MKEYDFETALYKKMYAILCGALSDSLDLLEEGRVWEAKRLIQTALESAEACYIDVDG